MNPIEPCLRIETRAAELAVASLHGSSGDRASGGIDAETAALLAHAGECGACSDALAYHRGLVRLLGESLAGAPDLQVPVPALPPRPLLRISRWRSAAAAAAVLAVAVAFANGAFLSDSPGGTPVRVRVVEAQVSAPSVPDQDLLALTAGWEAVASLRPALSR